MSLTSKASSIHNFIFEFHLSLSSLEDARKSKKIGRNLACMTTTLHES